jgi:hypothetical protein
MGPLFAAWLLAVLPQEQGGNEVPVISIERIELRSYEPRNVDAEQLFRIAERTIGRSFYVSERGGSEADAVDNLSLLADRIVMYDEPAYLTRIQGALELLDRPATVSGAENLVVREYTPRYVSLDAAASALKPFERIFPVRDGGARTVSNLNYVQERNQLVIRDTEEQIKRMQELLQRIDVPEPQALLSCYVVQADPAGTGAGLPADLLQNLGKIVPQFKFRPLGFALLQASIAPGRNLSLTIDVDPQLSYDLRFRVVAYDRGSASLSVGDCSVQRDEYRSVTREGVTELQRAGSRQLFSTQAVFRGGEYTVLGATGAEPVFLVVRLTPGP